MKRYLVLWWAGPLLVVIALIGHDALMATDALAASPVVSSQGGLANHKAGHSASWLNDEHQPDHSDACDVARPIAQPENFGFVSTIQIDTVAPFGMIEATIVLEPRPPWAEPTTPPGEFRALIQVFLI
jgi:hypothetical protein